jgi:peptidoglycan/xylan/chitin deacetylase (PgdA/CDA1 family)
VIGILLNFVRNSVIEEFFQLFKTPWEIFQIGKAYDVIISDKEDATLSDAKLIIILVERQSSAGKESVCETSYDFLKTETDSFPVYCGVTSTEVGQPIVVRKSDNKPVTGRSVESGKIVLRIGFNFFNEADYLLNKGQPAQFAHCPTLDIHIRNLRRWILEAGVALVEIPPLPAGGKFFACLTHDVDNAGIRNHKVDYTLAGFIYRALVLSPIRFFKSEYSIAMLARNLSAVAALPLVHLGLLPDFWCTFKEYLKLEKNSQSTFFFVPFKGKEGKTQNGSAPRIRAVKYEVSDLKDDIKFILDKGNEIGVHGIDSWIDADSGKDEIIKIQKLTGQAEIGVRMHWLYFSPDSPVVLEKAGYSFDATSGYNECIGFKAGTLQVFQPQNVINLLELPMHIMDTALFYPDRMNLRASEGLQAIKDCLKKAVEHGGVLTLNWHDRSIAPERLWDWAYVEALQELHNQGARFLTAGGVVEWFRRRRAIKIERVATSASPIKFKLTFPAIKLSDGFLLRVYSPQADHIGSRYRDIPIWGNSGIELFV